MLSRAHLRIGYISFGQIIRDLMKSDPEFAAKYSGVNKGKLLDDTEAIRLFEKRLSELQAEGHWDIIFVDGFGRSPDQIHYLGEQGMLRTKDCVFMIDADIRTCNKRWAKRASEGSRADDTAIQTFYDRWHLHNDSVPHLRTAFATYDASVVDINGGKQCKHDISDATGELFVAEHTFTQMFSHVMLIVWNIATEKAEAKSESAEAA